LTVHVLVTGGTGFIGSALVHALLERGDEVSVTSRKADRVRKHFGDRVKPVEWDPMDGALPAEALAGVDGIVNLAGESIAKGRWTRAKKRRLRESRVLGTRHLVEGIRAADPRPKVLVSTSAIGYYGDQEHRSLHEGSPNEGDFLGELCQAWEHEAVAARELGVRVPIVRIGIVLGHGGGAYPPLRRIFKLFAGGPIGLGRAWMSWVHLDDVVGIFLRCLDDENARDVYNATAPNPVPNSKFTAEMARTLHRPAIAPVPPIMLRITLGEFGKHANDSQRVMPLRTVGLGYQYKYSEIGEALESLA
jgi:uncharacterized protein (TIGR01777 family)